MKGIVPDGYLRRDEVLETVTNATRTSPELGNVVETTTRILNHMLHFRPVKWPIIMVDQTGDLVELPTDKWGEAVLAVSDLAEPRYEIFAHRLGFEGALASDAQRKRKSWPLKVIEPYLSFADLANLFDQNEELSSLQLQTEIRRSALEGKLEVYGRRPTGGLLERIPQLHFVGTAVDDRHSRSVAGECGWANMARSYI